MKSLMNKTRHHSEVDTQELLYEQEELTKKRWFVVANAILSDNVENTEYLAHNVDELKKLENASETDESISQDEDDQEIHKEKDMKIVRIREERYAQEELMHRVH